MAESGLGVGWESDVGMITRGRQMRMAGLRAETSVATRAREQGIVRKAQGMK